MKVTFVWQRPSINQGFAMALLFIIWFVMSSLFPYDTGGFFSGTPSWIVDLCFGLLVLLYVAMQLLSPGYALTLQNPDLIRMYDHIKQQNPKAIFNSDKPSIILPFEMKDGFDVMLKIVPRLGEKGSVNVLIASGVEGNMVFLQHVIYWQSLKPFCTKLMNELG